MTTGAENDWLAAAAAELARTAGLPADDLALDADATRLILDLARVAAHESGDRTNAPLVCYLLGRAGARGSAGLADLAAALRRAPL